MMALCRYCLRVTALVERGLARLNMSDVSGASRGASGTGRCWLKRRWARIGVVCMCREKRYVLYTKEREAEEHNVCQRGKGVFAWIVIAFGNVWRCFFWDVMTRDERSEHTKPSIKPID